MHHDYLAFFGHKHFDDQKLIAAIKAGDRKLRFGYESNNLAINETPKTNLKIKT